MDVSFFLQPLSFCWSIIRWPSNVLVQVVCTRREAKHRCCFSFIGDTQIISSSISLRCHGWIAQLTSYSRSMYEGNSFFLQKGKGIIWTRLSEHLCSRICRPSLSVQEVVFGNLSNCCFHSYTSILSQMVGNMSAAYLCQPKTTTCMTSAVSFSPIYI